MAEVKQIDSSVLRSLPRHTAMKIIEIIRAMEDIGAEDMAGVYSPLSTVNLSREVDDLKAIMATGLYEPSTVAASAAGSSRAFAFMVSLV